jgi:hypothetical protein
MIGNESIRVIITTIPERNMNLRLIIIPADVGRSGLSVDRWKLVSPGGESSEAGDKFVAPKM